MWGPCEIARLGWRRRAIVISEGSDCARSVSTLSCSPGHWVSSHPGVPRQLTQSPSKTLVSSWKLVGIAPSCPLVNYRRAREAIWPTSGTAMCNMFRFLGVLRKVSDSFSKAHVHPPRLAGLRVGFESRYLCLCSGEAFHTSDKPPPAHTHMSIAFYGGGCPEVCERWFNCSHRSNYPRSRTSETQTERTTT